MRTRLPDDRDCVDAHNHVSTGHDGRLDRGRAQSLLDGAARLGIRRLCVSEPLTSDSPSPDEVRRTNDTVLTAMKMSAPFIGFCFANPGYTREATVEIRRCIVEGGMRGVKLYHVGFFVGVATLSPAYAAWERDRGTCVQCLGFRALRLVPQYHGHSLGAAAAQALARAWVGCGSARLLLGIT